MVLLAPALFQIYSLNAQNQPEVNGKLNGNVPLKYPWAGGMNAIQFGAIDLNLDGILDLVAFDRHGDRKMCFINNQIFQQIDYSFKPEYADLLPELSDWAIFKDYDNDGRVDIFTYSPGWAGMMVYRNISENVLKFERVVYPFLKTFQENGYVNLLVTDVDYPGIADVDFDGDLDILTFWGLGSFITYHKNLSMEKYGHADSLDYELDDYCWGNFAESEESNYLYFDTCFIQQDNRSSSDERHTGSTLLMLDLNQDTVLDLLLGDIDFPTVFGLINTGTKYNAIIPTADTMFPSTSQRIELYSFPVCAFVDLDNNGVNDLLVSPFDPTLVSSENKKSVWRYLNTAFNDKPSFYLEEKDFLQSDMIDRGSGAYPVLYDWDGDGLLDLFVGNYGFFWYSYYDNFFELQTRYRSRIGYFKNTGTAQTPSYQLWDDDFGDLVGLNKYGLVPSFIDVDGDGATDMLVGDSTGNLMYLRNTGQGEFDIVTENYQNINDGFFSTPQIFDLDKDGKDDLVIGEQNGNLNYYRNEGSSSQPDFVFVTDSLGKINVTDYSISWFGYSTPWFFRLPSGETKLVVGSEQGDIFYYTNIDGNLGGTFTESDDLGALLDTSGVNFDRGTRTGAAIAEISKNGALEMIAGNYSGGLEYFNGDAMVMPGISESNNAIREIQCFPNPATTETYLEIDQQHLAVTITIIDLNGREIKAFKEKSTDNGLVKLSLDGLSDGLYFILARTGNQRYYGKVIVRE